MIAQEMDGIFRKFGWNIMGKGMVSISKVKITTDLSEAKIYLSLFQIEDKQSLLDTIESRSWEVRKELGSRIKNNVRRIPSLRFYIDDTLEYVDRIEEVLKNIKKKD